MRTIDQLVLDENNMAFHPMMGNSYQLNEIGREILTMLKQHKNKEQIINIQEDNYRL